LQPAVFSIRTVGPIDRPNIWTDPKNMRINSPISQCALGLLAAVCGLMASGCGSSTTPVAEPVARAEGESPKLVGLAANDSEVRLAVNNSVADGADSQATVRQVAHEEPARPKFDPIAENGKFFDGWKKPKLALVISGRQDGYLEPCGCAGLDRQIGGLSRRHSLIKELQSKGWPVTAVDVGGLVRRFGKQAEIQFAISAEALKEMGYGAVGFGPSDLRLSAGEIVAAATVADPKDSIFVSANVDLFGLTPKVRVFEAGGMRLGVTSVLGKEYQQQINNAEVAIQPPAEALEAVMGELKDCDVRILLAQATLEESKALAKQFPSFDLVVTSDGHSIPPAQPEKIGATTRLIETPPKAGYVTVVGFYDDPKQPMRFQRVALDSRFPDSAAMKQVMITYQHQLEQLGWDGLGLRSAPHPRASKGDKLAGQFASAASCKECHPTAYGIWSKTPHAHATETLTKLNPPRQYDAECISCHSTGWNPSEFFPYTTGFDSLDRTPQLAGNSCENCHGPGAAHVAAEKGRNAAKRDAGREAMKLTVAFARDNVCAKCHDHDNSPEFAGKDEATGKDNFDVKYWPKIEHKGKK
jgi:hypothetical protein